MKIIKKAFSIFLCAALCFCFASCGAGKIGDEELSASQSDDDLTVRITFPEGFTVAEIAARLEENGVCSAEDFMAEANNPDYLADYGIEIDEPGERAFLLEGYIFPDTYDFYKPEGASSVIKRFLRNFNSQISDDMKQRADSLGYSLDEILTIASIIQEEAGNPPEMPKVSAVLHNRLDSPSFSKLQCDACSFYLRNSVKPYVSEERYEALLQAYSTYNCVGLPEGPITNPGIDAINAALYPADSPYYFFVTDDNGVYYYAETFSEHQENCTLAGIY